MPDGAPVYDDAPLYGDEAGTALSIQLNALPHSVEVEQALIGAILQGRGAFDAVAEILRPEHFANPIHGLVWETCVGLDSQGKRPTLPQVIANIDHRVFDGAPGGQSYLASLVRAGGATNNAADYARQLADLAQRRSIITAAAEAIEDACQPAFDRPATDVQAALETALFDLGQDTDRGQGFADFSASVDEALAVAERCYQNNGQVLGMSTGLVDLDRQIGGLNAPDLIIVGARPAMGKTSLATGWALAAARAGKRVGIFSLEMGDDQLAMRILAAEAGIDVGRVRTGLSAIDMQCLAEAGARIRDLPIYIDDAPGLPISVMRSRAKRKARRTGLDLIIVDYIGLAAPPDSRVGKVHQIEAITMGLKALAKELDVPIVALAQLSRKVEERDDKRPGLSDLRDSGAIEQDADVVMFIYRHEYYLAKEEPRRRSGENDERYANRMTEWRVALEECRGVAELIVDKNRHGARATVKVHFEDTAARFASLARYGDDQ